MTVTEPTVTEQLAVNLLSDTLVAVIVALPAEIPVTRTPDPVVTEIVAIDELLVVQVTFWFVASVGAITAERALAAFTLSNIEDLSRVKPVAATLADDIVTSHTAVFDESESDTAVILAFPAETPVIRPLEETTAIDLSLLDQCIV